MSIVNLSSLISIREKKKTFLKLGVRYLEFLAARVAPPGTAQQRSGSDDNKQLKSEPTGEC